MANLDTKVQKLYSILDEFTEPKFHIEQKIHCKICDFIKKEFTDKKLQPNPEFLYEKTAFSFTESKMQVVILNHF